MKKNIPQLYILPFDHRATFVKALFGWSDLLTPKQVAEVKKYKFFIWESFLKVYEKMADTEPLSVLVDEQFGSQILRQAKRLGVKTILTTEKSGQTAYDFEYGKAFGKHLKKFAPTYAKALVRYNPALIEENKKQLPRLKKLADYCKKERIGLLFELLVPATDEQLKKTKTKNRYDRLMRATLTAKALSEIRKAGIEADVWKLEAMESKKDWQEIIRVLKKNNKKDFKIVLLGRDATQDQVRKWFRAAAGYQEICGFAVGRTIFFKPLQQFRKRQITLRQLVDVMAADFEGFIKYWKKLKKI